MHTVVLGLLVLAVWAYDHIDFLLSDCIKLTSMHLILRAAVFCYVPFLVAYIVSYIFLRAP
jgi:hypothetical protein